MGVASAEMISATRSLERKYQKLLKSHADFVRGGDQHRVLLEGQLVVQGKALTKQGRGIETLLKVVAGLQKQNTRLETAAQSAATSAPQQVKVKRESKPLHLPHITEHGPNAKFNDDDSPSDSSATYLDDITVALYLMLSAPYHRSPFFI